MPEEKTIFSKIIDGEVPGEIVFQDERCAVLRDINPQAPSHVLVVPKEPVPRLAEAAGAHEALLGHLLLTAARIAREEHLDGGYRVVVNNGPDGGESVPHLHVHVLGGRQMDWPPG
jgi:histidine triad (HIT) family protein